MNPALRNAISRPSLRAAVDSTDPIIASYAATSTRPVQPGHCINFVAASSQSIDIGTALNTELDADSVFIEGTFNTNSIGVGRSYICAPNEVGTLAFSVLTLRREGGFLSCTVGDNVFTVQTFDSTLAITAGVFHTARAEISGANIILTLDGVSESVTLTNTPAIRATSPWSIGQLGNVSGTNFDGKISTVKIGDNTGTKRQFNNDHSTGTTAIDSSGNATDGSFVNSPTWTTDSALPFSHLNQNGYTDVSGLLTPRDESAPTLDTDGNALQYAGTAFPRRPVYRDSNIATWDGVDLLDAAHLSGSETVISSAGTSTPSISAGQIDFTAGTCSALILSDGTIYNFSEGAGSTVHDSSGAGNDAVTDSSDLVAFWADSIDGEATAHNISNGFSARRALNGSSRYFSIPDNTDFDITDHLSVVSWGKNNLSMLAGNNYFASKYNASGTQREWSIGVTSSEKVQIVLSSNGSSTSTWRSTASVDPSEPHQYAFTFEGGVALKVYIDGVDMAGSFTSGSLPASLHNDIRPVLIGSNFTGSQGWDGSLWTTQIYDTAVLTPTEVSDLYADPFASVVSNLVGQWNLDELSGSTIIDSSSNSNDGSMIGSPPLMRVPADSAAPTLDVYAVFLTNPPVTNGNNESETTRDCYKIGVGDVVVPETDELANFEVIASGATNYSLGTTLPVDTVFIRDDSEDRLLAFQSTQTDTALVYANNFTGGSRWNDLAPWDDNEFWTE